MATARQPPTSSALPVFTLPDLASPSNGNLTDPHIPFRAQPGHHHATWARTFHSRPELYITPQSVEEVQKAVNLARRCRRRLVTVGSGHSPSDLTCSSAWMLDLRKLDHIQQVHMDEDGSGGRILAQAGISLHNINHRMAPRGLIMPNLGSIDVQSIAGAISTGTHGSSYYHGILAQSVRGLRIVLADGRAVWCSAEKQPDLFKAALVSLGAIGIIVEIEFHMAPSTDIEWTTDVLSLEQVLEDWNKDLWTQAEFVRCWWLPYLQRMVVWKAEKTSKPRRKPPVSFYGGLAGFQSYRFLLWVAGYFPRILPWVEWFVFGLQYRFSPGHVGSAVEKQEDGLLMDCLFSQFVNEWALPLSKGLEAISRLSKWLNGDERNARIPFSSRNLYVHSPVEVRISNSTLSQTLPRAYLDPTMKSEPTLYLNATLYRPFGQDPPCRQRYYEAFEWIMKQLGGRPHWAKNFATVTREELCEMYGPDLQTYLDVRHDADPDGMFVGDWHRRLLLGEQDSPLWLEEKAVSCKPNKQEGGLEWTGAQAAQAPTSPTGGATFSTMKRRSEESFDFMEAASATTDSGEDVSPMAQEG